MTYKVGNLKDSTLGFRCDRVSCLGNPFIMQLESDRSRVINSHNNFLNTALLSPNMYDSLELNKRYKKVTRYNYLKELGLALQHPSKTFLCWCYPKACHCDNYQDFYKFYTYGSYIVASKLKELFRKDIHTALEGLQRTEELLATKFKDIDIDLPEFRRSELPKRHYIAVKDNLSEPYEGEVWSKHNLAFLKEAATLSKWEAQKVAAILQLYSGSEFVVIEKEYKI